MLIPKQFTWFILLKYYPIADLLEVPLSIEDYSEVFANYVKIDQKFIFSLLKARWGNWFIDYE